VTIENSLKYEINKQVEGDMYDGTYQPYDELKTVALVNKFVYTRQWGDFVFSPGVKFRLYKKVRSESVQPLDHYLMRIPIVMFKYIVSPDTSIMLGMQGLPGFQFRYKDYVQSRNDYRDRNYNLQISNQSVYFGYKVWAAVGVEYSHNVFDEDYREFEEYKSSSTYAKVFLGW
jgi:hypothetical protein